MSIIKHVNTDKMRTHSQTTKILPLYVQWLTLFPSITLSRYTWLRSWFRNTN